MFENVLFDLDGTLSDPSVGITTSVAYALDKYGIKVENKRDLTCFIGPPLHESFQVYYGFSVEESFKAVEKFREYFSVKGLFENEVFAGIPELLGELKDKGKKLVVATSKPEVFAKRIIEHFSLTGYFDAVCGANLDGSRTKKDEVIRYALETAGINDLAETIMVGDRKHDIEGAHKIGIKAIGVTYGFGSREELTASGADYFADSPGEIRGIVLGMPQA